jgi:quercetin dioxygenase-like cupin family protein
MDTSSRDTGAWWFLDTLVMVHRGTSRYGSIVLEMTLPEGSAPPLHVHHGYDDSEYLLDGHMVVECAGELSMARAGDWLSAPRDVPHRFRVVGRRPARILIVHDAPSFLELIYAVGDPAERLTLPPSGCAPDSDTILRAFARHDVTAIGPSLTEDEARAFATRHA